MVLTLVETAAVVLLVCPLLCAGYVQGRQGIAGLPGARKAWAIGGYITLCLLVAVVLVKALSPFLVVSFGISVVLYGGAAVAIAFIVPRLFNVFTKCLRSCDG